MIVLILVLVLLNDISFFIQARWLVHLKVLRINDQAVSWNTRPSLQKYDITNDNIPNADTLGCTQFASDDWHILLFDIFR